MSQLHRVVLLCLLKMVNGLTEKEMRCVIHNPGTLDNEYLLGEWFQVYKFSMWLNQRASSSCYSMYIARASADDVERYTYTYGNEEPFNIDTTAVLYEGLHGYFKGMIIGGGQVKYFAWDPNSEFFGRPRYEARVYRKLNDNYMLLKTCSAPKSKWLLSRKRNPPKKEIRKIIRKIREVRRLRKQRLCA